MFPPESSSLPSTITEEKKQLLTIHVLGVHAERLLMWGQYPHTTSEAHDGC